MLFTGAFRAEAPTGQQDRGHRRKTALLHGALEPLAIGRTPGLAVIPTTLRGEKGGFS